MSYQISHYATSLIQRDSILVYCLQSYFAKESVELL